MKNLSAALLAGFLSLCFLPRGAAIDASVHYATFKGKGQLYTEVYIHVLGKTLSRKMLKPEPENIHMSQVTVEIYFSRAQQVIHFDKYLLDGPLGAEPRDFMDTRRYGLPAGPLQLEVILRDSYFPSDSAVFRYDFVLEYPQDKPAISDIQLLAAFSKDSSGAAAAKNGFLLEDLPLHFYNQGYTLLSYYAELYDMQALSDSGTYLLALAIEKRSGNGKTEDLQVRYARKQAKAVEVLLGQMDISELPSGNYQFSIRIVDRSRKVLLSKSLPFQRSNPSLQSLAAHPALNSGDSSFVSAMGVDSLRYSLKAIAPLVRQTDIEYLNLVLAGNNPNAQRTFLYNYWMEANPMQPEQAYRNYMQVARVVDKQFESGFGYGFESDRGFTYMRYGRPDDIVAVVDDPSASPYEIWTYYRLDKTKQSNVKFVFYNPTLAPGMYILLHSTARGELQNPAWQRVLYKNAPDQFDGNNHIDATEMQDNWNRNASNLFRDN